MSEQPMIKTREQTQGIEPHTLSQLPNLRNDPVHAFYLAGGKPLYTVEDFINALPNMGDEEFAAHVTPERNDFANWIREIFKLPGLAERMRSFKTRHELLTFLRAYFSIASTVNQDQQARSAPVQEQRHDAPPQAQSPPNKPGASTTQDGATPRLMTDDEASEILRKVKALADHRYAVLATPQTEETVSMLQDRLKELKKRMSEYRKLQKDLFFSGLLIKRIDPQMKLSLVTNDPKDLAKLRASLDELERTIEEERGQEIVDVKREIEAIVQGNHGEPGNKD